MSVTHSIIGKLKSEKAKGFMLGLLVSASITGAILPVLADTGNKTIEVYSGDVKIVIDGIQQTPTDVTGQEVEPFIYNGTTYLPVRALTNMLTDKNVSWDQDTHTVEINSPSGQTVILDDGNDNTSGGIDRSLGGRKRGVTTPEEAGIVVGSINDFHVQESDRSNIRVG